jgi:hypothetical protein
VRRWGHFLEVVELGFGLRLGHKVKGLGFKSGSYKVGLVCDCGDWAKGEMEMENSRGMVPILTYLKCSRSR